MRSLARIASRPGSAGEPLPPVFTELDRRGIRPRRGQVTMIAAAPNGGKSFLALYWTIRLVERDGLSALYFSADTDDVTMKVRASAILTGDNMETIEQRLLRGKGADYDKILTDLKSLRADFETDPSYPHMAEEVLAFNEAWGDYPEIIIVDNLMNVVMDGGGTGDDYVAMRNTTKALHRMARQTGAAIIVLHHMNESEAGNPAFPARRRAITGKVAQLPEMILSLGFDSHAGIMRVACVKNRSGKHDASADEYVELYTDVAHGAIYDSKWHREQGKVA